MRVGGLVGAALAVVLLAPGSAAAAERSFAGTCTFNSAAAQQKTGLGASPLPIDATIAGPGTCRGTLDGAAVSDDGAVIVLHVTGSGGCFGTVGSGLNGTGTITMAGKDLPVRAHIDLDSFRFAVDLTVRGTTSGEGFGHGSLDFLSSALPEPAQDGGLGCITNDMRKSVLNLLFTTSSTLVSALPAPPAAAPAKKKRKVVHCRTKAQKRTSTCRRRARQRQQHART